uniref:SLC41A/MgtE integral membrane domain-containing protein n=1 Tax=Cyclophora tenuis TaxID=216820 RepID=A0A7S1D0V7_CYCTE
MTTYLGWQEVRHRKSHGIRERRKKQSIIMEPVENNKPMDEEENSNNEIQSRVSVSTLEQENKELRAQIASMKLLLEKYERELKPPLDQTVEESDRTSSSQEPTETQRKSPNKLTAPPQSPKSVGSPLSPKVEKEVVHRKEGGYRQAKTKEPDLETATETDDSLERDTYPLVPLEAEFIEDGEVIQRTSDFLEMPFSKMVTDRGGWLVMLLVLQSMSSFIIKRNEDLLQQHRAIVEFLTMLVGAGGNAGNQASVGVIRGLAIGSIRGNAGVKAFLRREFTVGLCLSLILGMAGLIRAAIFFTPWPETIAITSSLFMIVMMSVLIGATLPLGMKLVGIDPAHSSTTIQVVMDILGVTVTVLVCGLILDSSVGKWLGV